MHKREFRNWREPLLSIRANKTILVVLSILALSILFATQAQADTVEDQYIPLIERYEQIVMGRTYPAGTPEQRIRGLEQILFGRASSLSMAEAVLKVGNVVDKSESVEPQRAPEKTFDIEAEQDRSISTPQSSDLLDRALDAYDGGDANEAIKLLKELLSAEPAHTDALFSLASIFEKQHKDVEALELYKRVLRMDPTDEDAIAGVKKLSKMATANPKLPKSSDWVEDESLTHFHISEEDNRSQSNQSYRSHRPASIATVKKPTTQNPEVLLTQAIQAKKANDLEKAILLFRKYLYQNPKAHQVKFALAKTYEKTGDKEMAKRVIKDALTDSPENAVYERTLAQLDPKSRTSELPKYTTVGSRKDGIVPMAPESGERMYQMAHSSLGRTLRYAIAGAAIGAANNSYYRGGMGRGALQGGLMGLALGLLRW